MKLNNAITNIVTHHSRICKMVDINMMNAYCGKTKAIFVIKEAVASTDPPLKGPITPRTTAIAVQVKPVSKPNAKEFLTACKRRVK